MISFQQSFKRYYRHRYENAKKSKINENLCVCVRLEEKGEYMKRDIAAIHMFLYVPIEKRKHLLCHVELAFYNSL